MSEKRFEFYSDDLVIGVLDTVTGRTFNSFEIVDCLNEQQDTIDKLEQRDYYNQSERYRVKELESENKRLQWKVKRLKAFLVEQGLAIDYLKWNR